MNIKTIISSVLYYVLSIIIYVALFIYSFFGGMAIIGLNQPFIYLTLIVFIPVILIFLPLIINAITNKTYITSLKISSVITLIYIMIILPSIHFVSIEYFKTFTKEKWEDIYFLRYLMIDDLEEKYDLIGTNKEEIIILLGKPNKNENNSICYFVKDDVEDLYYCLELDNGIVINTYINNR